MATRGIGPAPDFRGRSASFGARLGVSLEAVLIAGISSTGSQDRSDTLAPEGGPPTPVYALASLVLQGDIIQENEPKLDIGAVESGGERLKRGRGANRRDRRAIQRFLSRAANHGRLRIGYDAVAHDAKLQYDLTPITQARGFRHHRVPVAFYAGKHSGNIICEVHSLGRREHFDGSAQVALPPSAAAHTPTAWRRADRTSELRAGGSTVLKRFVHGLLEGLPRRKAGQDQAVRSRLLRLRQRPDRAVLGRLCARLRHGRGGHGSRRRGSFLDDTLRLRWPRRGLQFAWRSQPAKQARVHTNLWAL